jgi:pantoate--beta-alanine ligase
LLKPEIRKNAGIIFRTLNEAAELAKEREIPEIRKHVERSINSSSGFSLEYFEIVDDKQLLPVTDRSQFHKENNYFCCIALRAGKIRLIDNMEISLL